MCISQKSEFILIWRFSERQLNGELFERPNLARALVVPVHRGNLSSSVSLETCASAASNPYGRFKCLLGLGILLRGFDEAGGKRGVGKEGSEGLGAVVHLAALSGRQGGDSRPPISASPPI